MINTSLKEEQVFNSFIDTTSTLPKSEPKDLNLSEQLMELNVNVLDIWSFDDKGGGQIDLWKAKKERKIQPVKKVEKKEEEPNLLNQRKRKWIQKNK